MITSISVSVCQFPSSVKLFSGMTEGAMRRKMQLQTGSHGTAKVPYECWWVFNQNHSGHVTRIALQTRHFRFRKCVWNKVPVPFVFGFGIAARSCRSPWVRIRFLVVRWSWRRLRGDAIIIQLLQTGYVRLHGIYLAILPNTDNIALASVTSLDHLDLPLGLLLSVELGFRLRHLVQPR
jgi:hypothetical protein